MADNINVTPGTGSTIAADDIGGVLHQRVKISQGADGSATDVSSAAPLQVTGANGTFPVTDNGGSITIDYNGSAISTSNPLPIQPPASGHLHVDGDGIAGTPASGVLTVQGISGMTAIKTDGSAVTQPVSGTVAVSTINSVAPAFGSGVRGATVQRVTIATDDSVPVTGTFWQATQPVSGTVTANAGSGTMAVSNTVLSVVGGGTEATAQRVTIASDSTGVLSVDDNGSSLTVDGTVTANAGTGTFAVSMATNTPVGTVAHDSADSGAPIKIGGRARSSEITAVASDDRSDFITDLVGKQIILPYANPENFVSGAITTAMTGTTSTSLVAAPGAGLRNYITTIIVSNAHATVGTDVIIQDGSGGTTLLTIPAAAVYGGAVINLPIPLRQPTTNTAIYCANVTTGASTKVSAVGYKGY